MSSHSDDFGIENKGRDSGIQHIQCRKNPALVKNECKKNYSMLSVVVKWYEICVSFRAVIH